MSLDKEQFSYQLLTSTRYDPFLATLSWNNDHDGPSSFFLLPFHFDRLISAAKIHKWDHTTSILSYDHLKSTCLDAISKERQQNSSSSSTAAFRVNLSFLFFIFNSRLCLVFFLLFIIFSKKIKHRFGSHFHKMVKSSCPRPLFQQLLHPILLYYQSISHHHLLHYHHPRPP